MPPIPPSSFGYTAYPPVPNQFGQQHYSPYGYQGYPQYPNQYAPQAQAKPESKGVWDWFKDHLKELLIGLLILILLIIILFFMCRKSGNQMPSSHSFMQDDSVWKTQAEWPSTNPWQKAGQETAENLSPRAGESRKKSIPGGKIRFDVSCTAPLTKKDDSYNWVMKCNKLPSRQERKKLSQMTIACCNARNFKTPNGVLRLTKVMQMLHQTKVVRSGPITPTDGFTKFLINDSGTFATEVAMKYAGAGVRTVLLNGASKYSAGGGFIRGGRHAMEEALCTQSTLYLSLQRAIGLSETAVHIPDNGVVLSPDVEIFRAGTHQGYEFLSTVLELAAVVSIAMWNMNPKINDAPVDAPEDPDDYERTVELKWQAAFQASLSVDPPPKVIVVPDIGCGVYGNDPYTLGKIVGKCARAIRGQVDEMIFCGNVNFMSAAVSVAMA